MVHSGYGLDIFADDYMRYIAHYGITTLLIYVRSLDDYREFNDIIDRAAQYGLNVYAYSALFNRAYPEGEEGFKYYDALYGELFRRCPGFAGIVFVGESAEFPSKDPTTTGRLRQDNIGPDGKAIIENGECVLVAELKCKIGFSHSVRSFERQDGTTATVNDLRVYKFEVLGNQQQAAPQPQPQVQVPFPPQNQGGKDDDLPF
jgi:hypothetical protein